MSTSGSVVTTDYDYASQIIRSYSAFGEDVSATGTYISTISYDDTLQKSNGTQLHKNSRLQLRRRLFPRSGHNESPTLLCFLRQHLQTKLFILIEYNQWMHF